MSILIGSEPGVKCQPPPLSGRRRAGWARSALGAAVALLFWGHTDSAQAFVPEQKLAAWGALGVSHEAITRSALETVIRRDFGVSPTKSMERAIVAITESNAYVDTDQVHSSKHFDAENFLGGQEWIIFQREWVLTRAREGKGVLARYALGQALHPLQDFYAHSTWIELGNRAPLGMLTNPGATEADLLAALAQWKTFMSLPDEATCRECTPPALPPPVFTLPPGAIAVPIAPLLPCYSCPDNVTSSKLTSGYYGGEDRTKPRPDKCSHGGPFDHGTTTGYGLNKDTRTCVISPHETLHDTAAQVATQATVDFLTAIKGELTDNEYRLLLGVGPTLGVVMDTSSSMQDVIDSVSDQAAQVVASKQTDVDRPSQYVLVPFADPSIGPLLQTTDPDEFNEQLSGLKSAGGGDCPEVSMAAIQRAISAVEDGSSVFVYTDASAKDTSLSDAVAELAASKEVTVYASLMGSCSPYDPGFYRIAEATGGQVFVLDKAESGKISALEEASTRTSTAYLVNTTREVTGSELVVEFPVDPSISRLTISVSSVITGISGTNPPAAEATGRIASSVVNPSAIALDASVTGVTVTELSTARIVDVAAPSRGNWSVHLTGTGAARVVVSAETSISLDRFDFVELVGENHPGWLTTTGSPIANDAALASARLLGDFASADLDFVSPAGALLVTYPLETRDEALGYFMSDVMIPDQPFFVQITGEDGAGNLISRTAGRLYSPQYLAIEVPRSLEVIRGQTVELPIYVENRGDTDSFTLSASDDQSFLRPTNQDLELAASESRELSLSLVVPKDAPFGQISTLAVALKSKTSPRRVTFARVFAEVVATTEEDDDLVPSSRDNCPEVANTEQADLDADGIGDECDPDRDGDGRENDADNCPDLANKEQTDSDKDKLGDECDDSPNCACSLPGAPSRHLGLGVFGLLIGVGFVLRRARRSPGGSL